MNLFLPICYLKADVPAGTESSARNKEQIKKEIDQLYDRLIFYYERGELELAKDVFKKISALDPNQGYIKETSEIQKIRGRVQEDKQLKLEEIEDLMNEVIQNKKKEVSGEDIAKLKAENEQLKQALNRLEQINKELENKAKEFYLKYKDSEQIKKDYENLVKLVETLNRERLTLKKEIEQAKKIEVVQEDRLRQSRYHQQLGDQYFKEGLYELAIDAYLKSLEFEPNNARLHYLLGLLYKHTLADSKKAVYHLKRYLSLEPQAQDRKEIEYLIVALSKDQ